MDKETLKSGNKILKNIETSKDFLKGLKRGCAIGILNGRDELISKIYNSSELERTLAEYIETQIAELEKQLEEL